jgi:predicted permease
LGQQLVFDGRAYTVIGIVSADLQLPGDAEVITPLGQDVDPAILNRGMHPGIYVLGRRRSGVTLEQSQTELSTISRRLSEMYPKSNANHDFVAEPLQEELVEDLRPALLLLQGAVGLVLLTASANVASLLLTRALSHQREYAVRVALGASPWRLVRQSLTEGGVLGICGGAIGTVLAVVGTRPFVTVWPGGLAWADDVYLDWRALLFTLAVSLLSGLLVGVAPALCAAVREPESVLRAGTANGALNRRFLRRSFVVFEISLAVTLLIATGRVGRTVLRFSSAGPGLKARGVLVTQVALAPSALAAPASIRAAWRGVLQHVRTMPGVQSAAVVDIVPMTGENEIGYWLGPTQPRENEMPLAVMTLAAPDYLQVMGIRLREGRFFNENDRIGSEPVIAIDETMAQRAFRGREPVGNRISLEFLGSARVVGVVGHVRSQGLGVDDTASPHPQVYFPFAQVPDVFVPVAGARLALVVRTTVPPLGIVESIRNELRKETRDEVLYDFRTMEQIVSATLSRQRFFLLLFAVFSGLALVLACVGTYGALAHLTSQRAQELATRIALGAQRGDIVRLVLGESLGMILVGICLGMAVSLASAPLLNHLMVGLQPLDLLTTLSIIAVLVTTASFASFLPARRAGRIDPMKTIRQE